MSRAKVEPYVFSTSGLPNSVACCTAATIFTVVANVARYQTDDDGEYLYTVQGSPPGSKCQGEWRKDTLFSLPDAMAFFV